MFYCNLCNVALNNVQHTFVWANIAEDYDMCFECQEMNGDVAAQHSLVLMTLMQRSNGLFVPDQPPPPQNPAPFLPLPENSPFAAFAPFVPSVSVPQPQDPLFYKCWDRAGNVTLKMVTPGDHDEFMKIMKDYTRMEKIDRDGALEEGFQVPIMHSEMVKPLFRPVKKHDKVQITDFEDLTGASGICLGVDSPDGIVKLDHTSEIKIVPLENLVPVE